jgi:hypothetical protein
MPKYKSCQPEPVEGGLHQNKCGVLFGNGFDKLSLTTQK